VKAYLFLGCALACLALAAGASSAPAASRYVMSVTPVRPYQPGDQIVTGSGKSPSGDSITATGCQRVPSSGYLATGSFANTTAEYSNHWDWSNGSSSQPYSWWIKKTDGTTMLSGSPSSAGGTADLAANNYYFRIENRGAVPQAWNVCYDVL
jgi:hypothetical protein